MKRDTQFSATLLDLYARTDLPEQFRVHAATDKAPAEIIMYGVVGDNLLDTDLMQAFEAIGDGPVTLRINSPGGSVFVGYAMFNAIKRRGNVTVAVDGIAASAAAFLSMAADRVVMAETSQLMIHNCWSMALGNRHDFLQAAATMEQIDAQQVAMFAAKTGLPAAQIAAMLDAETYLTATKALELGFADAISEPVAKPAKTATASLRAEAEAPAPEAADAEDAVAPDPAVEQRRRRVRLADAAS